jgi:DOPA 4,5-dioxygenase
MDKTTSGAADTMIEAVHNIPGWHAHIYYDPATTRDRAARLRGQIAARFPTALVGNWHDELVGPHSRAMYQVVFDHDLFADIVPFIALHRDGLSVLIHADGGISGRAAHSDNAIWMGEILPVRLRPASA